MTQDWVEAGFRELGLTDVHGQEFDLPPQWFPTDWEVTFSGASGHYELSSLLPALRTAPTPPEGLDLEAIWVGTGTNADFAGRDVRGKAVFIHTIPAPGSMGHSASQSWEGAIQRAAERGADAIFVVYGISDNFAIWQGLGLSPEYRHIPGFFMGYRDGTAVREMIGSGEPVRVRIRVSTEEREGLRSASVWGTLPGATDEDIFVMAHLDGWFEAALDNASGVAVMMGLAEYFARIPQAERRRNLIFIGTAGHHAGSPGAVWFHDNRNTVLAKTALVINAEHVAVTQTINWGAQLRKTNIDSPRRWWVYGSDRLLEIVLGSYSRFGVSIWAERETSPVGEISRFARDAPSIYVIRSPEIKHSDGETPDWIPAVGLEAVARSYASIIDRVNQLDIEDLRTP